MKQELLSFLAMALMALVVPLNAMAEDFSEGGLYYSTLTDNTVQVVKPTSDLYSGDITIPARVKHNDKTYQVTAIGDYAFQQSGVTSVTLPLTGITSIGSRAFNDCTGLTEFTLPASITSIGEAAFYYCDNLKHLYVHSTDPTRYHPGSMAFSKIHYGSHVCTLHVPIGCTDLYAADATFSVFTQVEEFYLPTFYDLYVAGIQVTELNASDILGDDAASYNASTKTLTIKGDITASGSNLYGVGINSNIADLTIQVAEPATITASQVGMGFTQSATITGSSLLTIKSSIDFSIVSTNADITINEASLDLVGEMYCSTHGTLTIQSSTVSVESHYYATAIQGWDIVLLTDCYIETPEQGKYNTTQRRAEDKKGNVVAKVNIVPGKAPAYYDLYVAGTQVNDLNAANILGDGVASYDDRTKTLTIKGDITAPNDKTSCIMSNIKNLTINVALPSTLSATDGAIYLGGESTITGSSLLTVGISSKGENASALYTGALTIADANLAVAGYIKCVSGDMNITNSTVTLTEEGTGFVGSPGGSLYVTNSNVTVPFNASFAPVKGWGNLVLTDCYLKTPQGGKYNKSLYKLVDVNGKTATSMEIRPGTGPKLYNLFVAGTQVTSLNAADILGNGVASYYDGTSTLTIKGNITAPDAETPCIKSGSISLTINVTSDATLSATNYALDMMGKTTITGSSPLTVEISSISIKTCAISSPSLTIANANLAVAGTIICGSGNMMITNSTVTLTENNTGIIGSQEGLLYVTNSHVTVPNNGDISSLILWGDLVLTDCYLKTPEGGKYDKSAYQLVDAKGNTASSMEICPTWDVNNDGVVDMKDVTCIVNMLLGMAGGYAEAADLNGDHAITITDAVMLINKMKK